MKSKIILIAVLGVSVLSFGLTFGRAQTANWTGASGGEWNTAANWDVAVVPGVGTNASVGSGITANYNLPMAAASFGTLTLYGNLNVNASGFNCSAINVTLPTGTIDAINITNSGAVVSVSGAFALGTNGQATLGAGASLTAASFSVAAGETSHTAGTSTFTNLGGAFNVRSSAVCSSGSTGTGRFVILGGTNNFGITSIGRYASASASTLGTEGLAIYGGVVVMTNLTASAASYGTAYIAGGTATNFGNVSINGSTAGRYLRVVQNGGLFVVPDPGIIYLNTTTPGTETARYQVTGGTNIIGGMFLGASNNAALATVTVTVGGAVYVGSQGIATNGAVTNTVTLNSGGLFGATTDWTNSAPMVLSSGNFTFQTADLSGTAHNIYSSGKLTGSGALTKTGNGTLTLTATNAYSGNTTISAGTVALAIDASGSVGNISSGTITVSTNATFDVSGLNSVGGFVLGTSKTIAGVGTVNGTFMAGASSIISPAGTSAQGTLSFGNGLMASNATFNMELTGDPTGLITSNDAVKITGDLTVSGTNNISVTPIGSLGIGTYKLISFTGNFNGGLTNLSCVAGTLTNLPNEIDLIVGSVRPAAGLFWRGDGSANLWNTAGASNWLNGAALDRFYTGDTNAFDDSATNFVVNISGLVTPASTTAVTVNSTNDYTFADGGSGDITGTTGLTKTNSGHLVILTANDYTGVTTINGGTLAVNSLANGGTSSPIGAANNSSATLVINGGTLEYRGANVTIDRGMTFNANGGILSVTNATKTLTLNGNLTGAGALIKTGSGQITLGGANDYKGGTIVYSGNIRANPSGTIGTNALTLNGTTNTAAFVFSGDAQTLGVTLNVVNTNNYITVGGNDTVNTMTGNGTLNVEGAGALLFTFGAADMSAFTGTVYWDTITTNRFFPSSGTSINASGTTFDLGVGSGVLMNRDGGNYRLGSLRSSSSTTQVRGSNNSGSANTTYYIGEKGENSTFAGVIRNGTVGAPTTIVKAGTGALTLSGANTYTGTTTVSNGTLLVNGSLVSASTVTVTGGTLAGTGTIGGATTLNAGAILSAGSNSVGTLTFSGNLTLDPTSTNKFAVTTAGGASNSVSVAGTLTPNSSVIQITSGTSLALGTYTLFNYSGGISGSFNATPVFDVAPAATAAIVDTGSGQINLVVSSGPSGPASITNNFSGSTLSLTWPAGQGWRLVSQTNSLSAGLNPNVAAWGTVPGVSDGSATITIDPTQPTVFFRLFYP